MPTHIDALYRDDQLVYIDCETRTIIGPVEWEREDLPKSLRQEPQDPQGKPRERGKRQRTFHPFCTYRAAKHILWKKTLAETERSSLEEGLRSALIEPF